MTDPAEALRPATPEDLADALAFALRFSGRKRVHNADEIMAQIVAERLVDCLAQAGFAVRRRHCARRSLPVIGSMIAPLTIP